MKAFLHEANGTDVRIANPPTADLARFADAYLDRLKASCDLYPLEAIKSLGETLLDCWKTGRQALSAICSCSGFTRRAKPSASSGACSLNRGWR
jgi:hypothetical protein